MQPSIVVSSVGNSIISIAPQIVTTWLRALIKTRVPYQGGAVKKLGWWL